MKGNLKILPKNLEKEQLHLFFFLISLVYCNLRNWTVVHERKLYNVLKYLFCLLDKIKDKIKERYKEKEREKKKHKVMNEIKKENGEVKILLKSKYIFSDFSCTILYCSVYLLA